ncbi:MAG: hypothetical protein II393_00200 [Cytophagales bacterium]|nr:hypothetical protein [Cytophagales bacterium]
MDFTNQYLSYEEYQELEGTLEEVPFNELEFECRRIIDSRTQNRLKNADEIPQEVKLLENKMIQTLQGYYVSLEKAQSGVASENTDGYSVTYISSSQISQLIEGKIDVLQDLVSTYLFGVIVNNEHLLYCGV